MKHRTKSTVLAGIFMLISCAMYAQSSVIESVEELQKGRYPAFSINLPFDKKTTENAVKEHMTSKGFKGKKSKGAMQYMQITFTEIAPTQIDLYTKVNGNKNTSTLYVFVSKGYENFITSTSDPIMAMNVKAFVQELAAEVRNYDIKKQKESQQKQIDKSQKKYDKLLKKQEKMNKQVDEAQRELNMQQGVLNDLKRK